MRFVLLAVLLLLTGCGSATLPAVPSASAPAVVDGDVAEWAGGLRPVPGQPGLSVGVRNTSEALVVAVVAGAEWQARRIASGGLTLWLDPAGGRDRGTGLRFPLGVGGPPVARGASVAPDEERALRDAFAVSLDQFETVRGRQASAVAVGGVPGVETAATWTPRGLAVEVRVPLRGGASAAVGLGLELAVVSAGPAGPAAPTLTGSSDARPDYGADQQGGRGAATPTEARLPDVRTETTWLSVTLAP